MLRNIINRPGFVSAKEIPRMSVAVRNALHSAFLMSSESPLSFLLFFFRHRYSLIRNGVIMLQSPPVRCTSSAFSSAVRLSIRTLASFFSSLESMLISGFSTFTLVRIALISSSPFSAPVFPAMGLAPGGSLTFSAAASAGSICYL